jgi:hypothetical protein
MSTLLKRNTAARRLRKPNFFIVGAPKCATTSLWTWLADHPNIFMPHEKEPHFFNTDDRRGVATLGDYEALFSDAGEEHIAIGEASVWYLYSSEAIANILQYQPSSRFIVIVRNPIEMAPALHGEMLLSGHETVHEFGKAWRLQEERRRGRKLPAYSWAKRRMLYGEACSLGAQVERLLTIAPPRQVLISALDDIRANPRMEYLRILNFIGVPDDGRLQFPTHNSAMTLRWPSMRFLYPLIHLKPKMIRSGVWTRILAANKIEQRRPQMSPELADELKVYFRNDIERLGRLLDRDLSGWLAFDAGEPTCDSVKRHTGRS